MTNLKKRILTSLIALPVSMFFIIKGGNYIVSFLYAILILANFEAFSVFKRKTSIIFLDSVLVVSLLSILHLRNDTASSLILLLWVIMLTISSDIGGYLFGKIFKWKKFTSRLIKQTDPTIVPIYFYGCNSIKFQLASHLGDMFRASLLFHEVKRRIGSDFKFIVGEPFKYSNIDRDLSNQELADYLRTKTYLLNPKI